MEFEFSLLTLFMYVIVMSFSCRIHKISCLFELIYYENFSLLAQSWQTKRLFSKQKNKKIDEYD